MASSEAMTSSTHSFAYSYGLVKKCFLKICETSKFHNFLIFQPIFIRFSLFCSENFTLSSEIKLDQLRTSPLNETMLEPDCIWAILLRFTKNEIAWLSFLNVLWCNLYQIYKNNVPVRCLAIIIQKTLCERHYSSQFKISKISWLSKKVVVWWLLQYDMCSFDIYTISYIDSCPL